MYWLYHLTCQVSRHHMKSPGLDRFLRVSLLAEFFSQYCLPWKNLWFATYLINFLLKVFFWCIKLLELLKVPQKHCRTGKYWIENKKVSDPGNLFKYNLFNNHNFELTTKRTDSHETPSHVFLRILLGV